jgi:hypothetical protein
MLKIISIDEIKKSLPGYSPERADEFQQEAARIANKLFSNELKESKNANRRIVLTCGGSASGKTEFIDKFLPQEYEGLVFDSTLSSIETARIKIKEVYKSGNVPVICFIFPDTLKRAYAAFNNREMHIPLYRFYQTHSGSRATVLYLVKNFPDVEVFMYKNRYDPNLIEEDFLQYEYIEFASKNEMIEFLEDLQYSEEEIEAILMQHEN